MPHIYIHDDNLGPNVRFAVEEGSDGLVRLRPDAPPRIAQTTTPDPTAKYPSMIPGHLVIAVPDDLRTSPDALHITGLQAAEHVSKILAAMAIQSGRPLPGLTMSTRFSLLRDYLQRDLEQVLNGAQALGRVRLALLEQVPPMSLHVGVVRIGDGAIPLFDILFDTTDSDSHLPAFAYVVFLRELQPMLQALLQAGALPQGYCVDATI